MGFIKDVKAGLRREGVWIDAKQARVLLRLIERGYGTGLVPFTKEEAIVFSRLVERCQELKPS